KLANEPANAQIEATPVTPPAAQANPQGGLGQGQLGAQIANVTPALKQRYNLTRDTGVVVTGVTANSAAAQAGLQAGDGARSGKQFAVRIVRAGAEQTVQVQALQAT